MSDSNISARRPAVETSTARFGDDVEYYLRQEPRQLPSRYFYDPLGSPLFDAICHLPWYRVTRAELRLIIRHGAEILRQVEPFSTLVELGPGNGGKLAALIEAGRDRPRPVAMPVAVHLVDVSSAALAAAAHTLGAIDGVSVVTHQAPYEVGLAAVTRETDGHVRTLTLFLGSNIGNFDPPGAEAFLAGIRAASARGAALLVGADLVKPERELLLAYDDPLGLTGAFNRNLLMRINRELGGDFDVESFRHRAVWNEAESRVEMHLVSERRQRIRVQASHLDFVLEAGETIWTESSYKYTPAGIETMLSRAGFRLLDQWIDLQDGFALTLVSAP